MQHKNDIAERLMIRAQIRRQIPTRKSVQEGKPDRIADLLEEASKYIIHLEQQIASFTASGDKPQ